MGSLLALESPPGFQSELLLARLLATHRTVYVSTSRPEDEDREWATAKAGTVADLTVESMTPDAIIDSPTAVTVQLTPESVRILDPVNGLETASRQGYLDALDHVKRQLRATDSVGVMHRVGQDQPPAHRWQTLNRADDVWELEVHALSRDVKTRLLVMKSRYGYSLTEPIPLVLTVRVRIDTSRRIA